MINNTDGNNISEVGVNIVDKYQKDDGFDTFNKKKGKKSSEDANMKEAKNYDVTSANTKENDHDHDNNLVDANIKEKEEEENNNNNDNDNNLVDANIKEKEEESNNNNNNDNNSEDANIKEKEEESNNNNDRDNNLVDANIKEIKDIFSLKLDKKSGNDEIIVEIILNGLSEMSPIKYCVDLPESEPCFRKLLDHVVTIASSSFNIDCLQHLAIGDDCFGSVKTFKIDGLNQLKSLKIGKNSFTQLKKDDWDDDWSYDKANNQSKSFHILNCESLESIEIGEYSFSDFAGQFELKNLPSLQSIQIGEIGSKSWNFYWSSFVIGGILNDIEYVMIRSS